MGGNAKRMPGTVSGQNSSNPNSAFKNTTPLLDLFEDDHDARLGRRWIPGPVEILPLFNSCFIQKNYGPYTMSYVRLSGFKKLINATGTTMDPTDKDIWKFKADIYMAAKNDLKIFEFLKEHKALHIRTREPY